MRHLKVIACIPMRIEDYPPARQAMYLRTNAKILAEGGVIPSIYPGSISGECVVCEIEVAIGPKQAELLGQATVMCFICAMMSAAGAQGYELRGL